MNYLNELKVSLAAFMSMLLTFLHPLSGNLHALFAVFLVNFVCGILADIIANDAGFQLRKAVNLIYQLAGFFGMACFIYYFGKQMDVSQSALNLISWTTYFVFWAFGTNCLRNMLLITPAQGPSHRVISVLYYWLSVEFVKDIPLLSAYLKHTKDGEDEQHG
jgi:hypothetical protein